MAAAAMPVIGMMVAVLVTIGAVLRIERRFDRRKPCAQPAQHVLDHMVAADAQPVADDLHVEMPVADMPGEPRQLARIGRCDLDQRLRPAGDAHHPAIVEDEAVTVAQCRRLRQVEQELGAALAGEDDAAAMALLRIERDADRRRSPRPSGRPP